VKSITENPYRIIGILANANAKEIQARKGKISAYAKVGKKITSDYDLPHFNSIERTTFLIDNAFSATEQNQNKVFHSLFWFTNLNPIDKTAIQHLVSGNKEKATEIWDKLTDEKEVTSKNYSAFNNIGTLYLLDESKEKIKKGITIKVKLIDSDSFKDFVYTVADETFTVDKNKQIEILIDELLTQFKNQYSSIEIIELFSNCSETIIKYLSKKITEEPIHKVEFQIDQCTQKRSNDKINAYKYGTDLYSNSKEELKFLKTLIGINDLNYKFITDGISKELLNCGIDYFLSNGKKDELIDKTIQIFEYAKEICINKSFIDIIEEKINEILSVKYEEINFMLILLKGISDAIKDLNRENKYKPYSQKKSINVQKIDEIIVKEITLFRIQKIIKLHNKSYLSEFISYVIFIRSELYSSSGIKKIISMLVNNLPQTHDFVISEREREKKYQEILRKRKAEEAAKKKRELEVEIERKRKEKNQTLVFWSVIGLILLFVAAKWGWEGVIWVIVIGVLVIIAGN
jgi:hypothetical protein